MKTYFSKYGFVELDDKFKDDNKNKLKELMTQAEQHMNYLIKWENQKLNEKLGNEEDS